MAFDRDSAIKAAQTKALKKKLEEAKAAEQTMKQTIQAARREQEAVKTSLTTRYYISTPLALADEDVKGSAVKLEIQIPGGPTAHSYQDEDGKDHVLYREMGSLMLLEGEGWTADPLWAEWIEREYSSEGWTVSELRPNGLASYAQEMEEIKQGLALQGAV